ncbi:hypothetical protein [Shewanella woodyi]|uniref:hypothetical protein n=1 Tax=Shewanella woodyi TaxID=60961 RepID=UPI00031A3837|nr:hypothetical protein [Shewanella woodyi]
MEEGEKVSDIQKLWEFFLNHSLLVLTTFGLLASTIGYATQYTLLKQFGVNFVNYAELDDFLLAAWKVPASSIYIIFMCLMVGFLYSITVAFKKSDDEFSKLNPEKANQKKNKLGRYGIFFLSILGITFIFILAYSIFKMTIDSQLRVIQGQTSVAIVHLRSGGCIPYKQDTSLSLISATSKFMFFYQQSDISGKIKTIAIPIASISNVEYMNNPKAMLNPEPLTDNAE